MSTRLTLYSTSACHLCEEAAALLNSLPASSYHWQEIEISEDEMLLQQYGLTIPVIRREDTGEELVWPFNHGQLLALLTQESGK